MLSFEGMTSEIQRNVNEFNNNKKVLNSATVPCVIKSVNERKFTVDVYVPQSGATYVDVVIGTCLLGSAMQIKALPSKHQKGLIIISNQHPVTLIATIPNTRYELEEHILQGEAVIGNKNTSIKVSADNKVSLKTNTSVISMDSSSECKIINNSIHMAGGMTSKILTDNGQTSSKESFFKFKSHDYFKTKSQIFEDQSLEDAVLNDNKLLLSSLEEFISKIETFSKNFNAGDKGAIKKLEDLSIEIENEYGKSIPGELLEIAKGTFADESVFSIKYKNASANTSLSFMKDGTIEVNCKDLIVKKGVVQK